MSLVTKFQLPRFALPALVLWIAYSTGITYGQMTIGWEKQRDVLGFIDQPNHGVSSANDGVYIVDTIAVINSAGMVRQSPCIRKYDLNGRELWTQKYFGSEDKVQGVSAAVDGVYIAGSHFDPSIPAFVAKYDRRGGNRLWARELSLGLSTVPSAVGATGEGVYVVGHSSDLAKNIFGYIGPGFLRKYDVYGNELWTVQFGTFFTWSPLRVSPTTGGVYVAGAVPQKLPLPGQADIDPSVDAFLAKYDLNGNLLWTRQFGTSNFAGATGVSATTDGVYVTGNGAPRDIQCAGCPELPASTFIRKYDLNGNALWTRRFGNSIGNSGVLALGVSATANGVFSLVAQVYSPTNDYYISQYDPNNGSASAVLKLPGCVRCDSGGIDATTGRVYVTGNHEFYPIVNFLAMLIPGSSPPRPGSEVSQLPELEGSASFNVRWSGLDIGGPGIQNYTIYVSDNGGPFTPWLTRTTATQGAFIGVSGHSYGFYSIAQDAAGNVEAPKSVADAVTYVGTVPPGPITHVSSLPATTTSPNFLVQWSATAEPFGVHRYDIYVSDNGGPFALWRSAYQGSDQYYLDWFSGYLGHTYAFYSRGLDWNGNYEGPKSGAEATTRTPTQLPEDVNGDGRIDCSDIAMVKAAMGSTPGRPNWKPAADVNRDGVVNLRDLTLISQMLPSATYAGWTSSYCN